MQRKLAILLLVIFPALLSAQSKKAYERAGDAAFKTGNYAAATEYFGKVLQKDAGNNRLWWKYAECARLSFAYGEAEKVLLRIEQEQAKDFPLLYLRLGEINHGQGDYTAAVAYLEKFIAAPGKASEADQTQAARVLEHSRWAAAHQQSTPGLSIAALDKKINSPYSDFAPWKSGDTLFFSSYRFEVRGDKSKPRRKITRPMWSIAGGRAREVGRGIPNGGDSVHVAHTAFTPDGNFLFYTQCKNISETEIRCALWLTVRDLSGRWTAPQPLPEPVNLPDYTATHPSIGFDTSRMGLVLWFSSDRPGGEGGLDIWSVPLDTVTFCPCNRPPRGKRFYPYGFSEPQPATAVNTPGDEITPFFDTPAQTLYFSSDHYPGFGGYDIFRAVADSAGAFRVENLGYGLNSSYNDLYFFLESDGRNGLISSNRPGALYLDEANKSCCNDLFAFRLPLPPPPADSLPRPEAVPEPPLVQTPEPEPEPEPQVLQDFVGLPLYFDNDEPDKRTRRTTTRRNYAETVLDYLARQEEYRLRFAEGLKDARAEAAEDQIDRFFEDEVRAGYERLEQLSAMLLQRLEQGEKVEIIIKGFTSPRAKTDYNLNLGKRRISSVRNYFDAYQGGIFIPYIENGQLRVSETSFGETTARAGISDRLEDERNSVYHPDAARERRVEIVEIRENN